LEFVYKILYEKRCFAEMETRLIDAAKN